MKELKFTLTSQEIEIIYTALGELPAKMSFDLIVKLQRQQQEQKQQPAPEPKKTAVETKQKQRK